MQEYGLKEGITSYGGILELLVASLMIDFVAVSGKSPAAVLALVRLLPSMSSDVVSQAGPLGESFATVRMVALVGQDTQMNVAVTRERGLRVEGLAAEWMVARVHLLCLYDFFFFLSLLKLLANLRA